MPKNYWLLKSEPESFALTDLRQAPAQITCWDGVRNYQARNFLRAMKVGDLAFFYHSNAAPSSIVGIVKIVRKAYPDHTAFDPDDPHYDPKSLPTDPAWFMVDVQFVRAFATGISLAELRQLPDLQEMELLRKGSRLSVQPVRATEWKAILKFTTGRKAK